jgi:transposase
MSKEELGKLALIKGALDGSYTVGYLAKKFGVSTRQVKKLKKAVRENGDGAVIHGNSGRHPANATSEALKEKIITLKKSNDYADTNFTHFQELLKEREGIAVSYSTVSTILKTAGIVSKKKHRTEGKRFRRRKRRSSFGELLQTDATPFDWFGAGKRQALHGFIDDATGNITALYLCENECLMGYLELLRLTLIKHGVPLEMYADRAGIFFVNNKKEANWTPEEQLAGHPLDKTQFGTIVEDKLGIHLIPAYSPQAKGRIERLWETLQDRLPIWLRLHKITTVEGANAAFPDFIAEYNAQFSVESESPETSFVPLSPDDDLDTLLAVKYERTTDNCGCFSFQNCLFQIVSDKPLAKKKITFLFSEKIGFKVYYDKKYYPAVFFGLPYKKTAAHLPDVIKILIQRHYYADGKTPLPFVA